MFARSVRTCILAAGLALGGLATPALAAPLGPDAGLRAGAAADPGIVAAQYGYGGHHGWGGHHHGHHFGHRRHFGHHHGPRWGHHHHGPRWGHHHGPRWGHHHHHHRGHW